MAGAIRLRSRQRDPGRGDQRGGVGNKLRPRGRRGRGEGAGRGLRRQARISVRLRVLALRESARRCSVATSRCPAVPASVAAYLTYRSDDGWHRGRRAFTSRTGTPRPSATFATASPSAAQGASGRHRTGACPPQRRTSGRAPPHGGGQGHRDRHRDRRQDFRPLRPRRPCFRIDRAQRQHHRNRAGRWLEDGPTWPRTAPIHPISAPPTSPPAQGCHPDSTRRTSSASTASAAAIASTSCPRPCRLRTACASLRRRSCSAFCRACFARCARCRSCSARRS